MLNFIINLLILFSLMSIPANDEFIVYNSDKDPVVDLQFNEAQENCVIDFMCGQDSNKGISPMFGDDVDYCIESLACIHYSCRRNAIILLKQIPEDKRFRVFVWGSRHKNKAIAQSCIYYLRGFYVCDACKGTGINEYNYNYLCGKCHGIGQLREFMPNLFTVRTKFNNQ